MANDYIEAARVYHEVTKHSYTSVRAGAYSLDWDNRPLPYKIYPQAGALALPRDLELSRMPTLHAIASPTATGESALDLDALTRLLFCADGLTRRARVGPEDYHFRAAASAGALYPIEIYVAASDVANLEAGLYHFSPADLKMRGLRRGDWRELIARAAAMRPSIQKAGAILVMSAIFWRSAWKYRARAYRYCFWDGGTILANLLAAAAAEGIGAEVVTAFVDSEIESILGVDGEREAPICIVALGSTEKPATVLPELAPLALETIPLSQEEVAFEPILKLHREARLESADQVRAIAGARPRAASATASASGERFSFELIDAEGTAALGETILRRGSTRVFAHEPIGAEELATILSASSRHPNADFPPLTDTYLIVNSVDGMKPGAYYFHRDSGLFELLKAGEFRGEAGYLCLEQPLGQDCSALLVFMADLERAMAVLGNRGYRDAHLEAGILGGRAYLAAYALDRGASGLTFYDDDTAKFFEPHASGKSPLLMVAIGVPRSKAKSQS